MGIQYVRKQMADLGSLTLRLELRILITEVERQSGDERTRNWIPAFLLMANGS